MVQALANGEGLPEANRPHYHPDTIEFCKIARGQLDWFIGEENYAVKPGDVLVIPPNVVHGAVDSNLQPGAIFAVHLMPETLSPSLAQTAGGLAPQRIRDAEIGDLIERIVEAHVRREDHLEEMVAALGVLLVIATSKKAISEEERKSSLLIRQAKRALLGENGVRPTVNEVANRLGVSSVWLHKLFVKETGVSPGDWTRARRFTEAKRKLEESNQTTVDIALSLGYSTGQAFAAAFRKESGMTPSEYRALHASADPHRKPRIYRVSARENWIDGVVVNAADLIERNTPISPRE